MDVRATLDEINETASWYPITGWSVELDSGAHLAILTVFPGRDGKLVGYGRLTRTNLLCRFEQSGTALHKGWGIRCRVVSAEDTGDLAGTLEFKGNGNGGYFNHRLLALPFTTA
jgi:hypothetical protein